MKWSFFLTKLNVISVYDYRIAQLLNLLVSSLICVQRFLCMKSSVKQKSVISILIASSVPLLEAAIKRPLVTLTSLQPTTIKGRRGLD